MALALAKRLPDIETVVVRSTKMGVIGVGEGTIATIGRFLHGFLGIDPQRFHREVHPSIKLGIQFKWGNPTPFHYTFAPQFTAPSPAKVPLSLPRGYYCRHDSSYADMISALMYHGKAAVCTDIGEPRLASAFAYHLENQHFVGFLETIASESGITKIDAVVKEVTTGPGGVDALLLDNDQRMEADLFVDCSGFRSELIGRVLNEPFVSFSEALLCDRALVGGWNRSDEIYNAFTTAEAMDAGWSWRIEHDQIINRGYVYSSSFISDDQAEVEFRRKNPRLDQIRSLKFRSGVHRRAWVDNVVAIGNSYGFVEPLEATAIGMICASAGHLVQILEAGRHCLTDVQRRVFNSIRDSNWEQIRDFLALHYQPNQSIDTPFWQACRHDIPLGQAQDIVDYYQTVGPDFGALNTRLKGDIFGAEGYLSMLVGQNVPYQREVNISHDEQTACRLRAKMAQATKNAIDMKEYLELLRCGATQLPTQRYQLADSGKV